MSRFHTLEVFCKECKRPARVEGNKYAKVGVCDMCDTRKILIDKLEV